MMSLRAGILAALALPPLLGCAGPVLGLSRSNETASQAAQKPAASSDATESGVTSAVENADAKSVTLPAGKFANVDADSSTDSDAREATSGSNDPLAAKVRSLNFETAAEEAEALAALKSVPQGQREVLLRMMEVGLAARERARHDSTASIDRSVNTPQTPSTKTRPVRELETGYEEDALVTVHLERAEDVEEPPVTQRNAKPQRQGRGGRVTQAAQGSLASNASSATASNGDDQPVVPRNADSGNHAAEDHASAARDEGVVRAVHVQSPAALPRALTAKEHLGEAIRALEAEISQSVSSLDRMNKESQLRMLYLAAGRRDDALRSIAGFSSAEQDFWSKELYGLSILLDAEKQPDRRQRARAATDSIREAAERLGEVGGLVVKNLQFCNDVKGYGSYTRFPKAEFKLGQEVLLYCEVENFKSVPTDKGYHSALKASYQVFDANGNRVAEKELALKEEHCQNRRRDFFVPYFLWMPKLVDDGNYKLKLTVEDTNAQSVAESTIEFSIKGDGGMERRQGNGSLN